MLNLQRRDFKDWKNINKPMIILIFTSIRFDSHNQMKITLDLFVFLAYQMDLILCV